MLGDLVGGAYDGLRGALYLMRHPRLWLYVLLPAVVAVVILVFAVGSVLAMLSAPIAWVAAFLPGAWADNVLQILAGIALTIAGFSILISIAAIVAGPFNEMLSESIEKLETGAASPRFRVLGFLRDLIVGLFHAIRRVTVYLVVMLALLILGIAVPVVGTIVAAVLGALATAQFAAYDAYDSVWSRRRLRYRDKLAYLRARRGRTLGLGAVVAVVLVIPGLNVVGLAVGATGATLRVLEVERAAKGSAVADITGTRTR